MFYGIGVKVRVKHTGDAGVVKEWLNDGMLMIYLPADDMTIPVFEEDVVREEAWNGVVEKKSKPKTQVEAKSVPLPQAFAQYTVLKSMGIQLAFDEVRKHDEVQHYNIFLINDTEYNVLFEIDIFTADHDYVVLDEMLPRMSVLQIGELPYDALNEHPELQFACWQLSTEGKSGQLWKELKIKPKTFFSSRITAPLLDREVHHFVLINDFEAKPQKEKDTEDLKTYTKRAATPATKSRKMVRTKHEVSEMANFASEIDLHIENLTSEYKHLSNGDILKIQLRHFDAFMDKAMRLGVERVFVVHGLGKGTLKDVIHSRLISEYSIKTFRNEYHPRYGWGATEVEF